MSIRPHNTRLTVVLAAGAIFFSCSALAQAHGGHPLTAAYIGSAGTFRPAGSPPVDALHHWRYAPVVVVTPHTKAPPANTPDQASLTITPSPSPSPSTAAPEPEPSTSSSPAPVATGGIFSYSQLEQLWVSVGGPSWAEGAAATVAECESGGNPNAYNPSGASGLWQILGAPQNWTGSTDWFNPTVNAEAAVAKFTQSGDTWAQWSCQP